MELVIGAELARIDPQALAIKLHRAEVEVEAVTQDFVVHPEAHELILGIEQVGNGSAHETRRDRNTGLRRGDAHEVARRGAALPRMERVNSDRENRDRYGTGRCRKVLHRRNSVESDL